MTTPVETSSSSDAITRRHAQRDAVAAFALAGVLTLAAGLLANAVPIIAANVGLIVAAILILVPGWFLRRRGERDTAYGLAFDDVKRGLGWGVGATLVTFVLFVPAFHLWSTTVEHRTASFSWSHYRAPSERYFGEPMHKQDGDVHVWTWGGTVHIAWTPQRGPWALRIDAEGTPEAAVYATAGQLVEAPAGAHIARTGVAVQHVHVAAIPHRAQALRIHAVEAGQPLDAGRFVGGSGGRVIPADGTDARVPLSLWWMVSLVLSQFVLIALPEEFFYRGFVQEKLKQAGWRRAWRVGPLDLTTATVLTSALFAVGHLFIGFGVHRLAVFFPSLLFGALRDRTGGIVAPTVYHACCNLMVYACSVHYF